MEQIFVSSMEKELQSERYAVRDFVHYMEHFSAEIVFEHFSVTSIREFVIICWFIA